MNWNSVPSTHPTTGERLSSPNSPAGRSLLNATTAPVRSTNGKTSETNLSLGYRGRRSEQYSRNGAAAAESVDEEKSSGSERAGAAVLLKLSDVQPKKLRWLWQSHVP